jgi:hypothetical protein
MIYMKTIDYSGITYLSATDIHDVLAFARTVPAAPKSYPYHMPVAGKLAVETG